MGWKFVGLGFGLGLGCVRARSGFGLGLGPSANCLFFEVTAALIETGSRVLRLARERGRRGLGLLVWIEHESLILAQNERWRHA